MADNEWVESGLKLPPAVRISVATSQGATYPVAYCATQIEPVKCPHYGMQYEDRGGLKYKILEFGTDIFLNMDN